MTKIRKNLFKILRQTQEISQIFIILDYLPFILNKNEKLCMHYGKTTCNISILFVGNVVLFSFMNGNFNLKLSMGF